MGKPFFISAGNEADDGRHYKGLIELNTETDPNTSFTKKAAFVKKDGFVVNLNENQFTIQAPEDDYYVVIYHRNHLSIMSDETIHLTNNISVPLTI